ILKYISKYDVYYASKCVNKWLETHEDETPKIIDLSKLEKPVFDPKLLEYLKKIEKYTCGKFDYSYSYSPIFTLHPSENTYNKYLMKKIYRDELYNQNYDELLARYAYIKKYGIDKYPYKKSIHTLSALDPMHIERVEFTKTKSRNHPWDKLVDDIIRS